MSTDFGTGVVEFDQIVNGEQPEPARRGRGRPRNTPVTAPTPVGLTFTEFEGAVFAGQVEARADDIEQANPDDGPTTQIAKFLRDTAQAVRGQHPK